MRALKLLLKLTLLCSAIHAGPPPPPLPADVIELAAAVPTDGGLEGYQNNIALLEQVQLSQDVRNGQIAAFGYAIENIPKFGFSGYPRGLIHYLRIWQAQVKVDQAAAETVLAFYDLRSIAPCKYSFSLSLADTSHDTTDAVLLTLLQFQHVAIGQNAYLASVAGPIFPALSAAAASAASVAGRRAA